MIVTLTVPVVSVLTFSDTLVHIHIHKYIYTYAYTLYKAMYHFHGFKFLSIALIHLLWLETFMRFGFEGSFIISICCPAHSPADLLYPFVWPSPTDDLTHCLNAQSIYFL